MSRPAVSIVVPTRNRVAWLRRALPPLIAQRAQGPCEVVVVDDGSEDGTGEFLRSVAADGQLRVMTLRVRGAAAARNAGILAAHAPVIACTDDDCLVPPDWAHRLEQRLLASGAAAVGGRVLPAAGVPLPSRVSQAITNGVVAALNDDPQDALFLTSNNVAYRREALLDAGLFDEAFRGAGAEERELHSRLRGRGGRLVFAAEIRVEHHAALDWAGFLRQQAAYGRGARLFYRRDRSLRRGRTRDLGPRRYARALLRALAELAPRDRPALLLAWPLSQLAVTWGYLRGPGQRSA